MIREPTLSCDVTSAEVPFLVDPALRFWALVSTWRRYGGMATPALHRLQSAQLDLAGWHWQQADDPLRRN